MSGLLRPLSLVCSNDCSITSRARRLSVATVVGYLRGKEWGKGCRAEDRVGYRIGKGREEGRANS